VAASLYLAAGAVALYLTMSSGLLLQVSSGDQGSAVSGAPGDISGPELEPWEQQDARIDGLVAKNGPLPVPRRLPDGFSLATALATHPGKVRYFYTQPAPAAPRLTVNLYRDGQPVRGPAEYVSSIRVNDQDGLLVKGMWVQEADGLRWEADLFTTVVVPFKGWTVEVTGREADEEGRFWTAETLTRIAASLQLHE
jgi:hypothetical protein